jgi:type IV/VI secretion system ImpK/VasF family protein
MFGDQTLSFHLIFTPKNFPTQPPPYEYMATTPANVSVSETTRQPDNLALLFQEMFTVIVRLRANRQRFSDLEVFRMQIRNTLKSIEQEGLAVGYQMEDLRVATFAVVAFLDESIFDSGNPFFEDWPCQPLQLELFGVQAAGEVFYRNLERILDRPDSPTVADLLEVHQLCFLLGFRGRYGLCRSAAEISGISRRLEARIDQIRGEASWGIRQSTAPVPPSLSKPLPYYLRPNWTNIARTLLGRTKKDVNTERLAEIDLHFIKADDWVRDAHGVKQLAEVPAVLFLGDAGAAKSTLIAKSGIQAELLAGHGALVPTQTLNLWHGWNTLFVDPAGVLLEDPAARAKLFYKIARSPVRCVILAVDCGAFFQPGSSEILAVKSRHFQTLLSELARETGLGFPIYVVFTKADQIPYFQESIANLNQGEVAEAFGVTLSAGQSISGAFQTLYRYLAAERKTLLAREQDTGRLPDVYEFPREFAKLRPLLVRFLADLGPLQGFYFTGVRPEIKHDPTASQQWVFVKRLFSEVVLADHRPSPLTTPRALAAAAG